MGFIVETLAPGKHRRELFDCGVAAPNDFLQNRALREMDAGTSACFVPVPKSAPTQFAGYYTLSAAIIRRTEPAADLLKKLPRSAQGEEDRADHAGFGLTRAAAR